MMKTYINKEGYEIRATEKAYKLLYKNMGFSEKKDEQEETDIEKMNVKQLKAYCDENGIVYESNAKKEELFGRALAKKAEKEKDDSDNPPEGDKTGEE